MCIVYINCNLFLKFRRLSYKIQNFKSTRKGIYDDLNRGHGIFVILPYVVFNMHGSHGNFETHPKPGVQFGGLVVVEFVIQKMANPILKIQILEVSLHVQYELQKR